MGYGWYRIDGGFTQHPKTLALQAVLNEPLADAYVNRLWSWVHRYAPTGLIPSRVTTQIEVALGWRGAPGRLLEAMTEVGWLEVVSDGLEVHDWADYQSFWAGKAKKEKAKKRQRRKRSVTQSVTHLSRVTAPPTGEKRTERTEQDKEEKREVVQLAPPPPPTSDPFSSVEGFFAEIQVERKEQGLPPEAPPHPSKLSAFWSQALMELNGDAKALGDAYVRYTRDKFWRSKQPPAPINGFISQWRNYVPTRQPA